MKPVWLLVVGVVACSGDQPVAACAPASFYPIPDGAVRWTPPSAFGTLFAAIESCSGFAGDFSAIEWWQVPGAIFIYRGSVIDGIFLPPRTIVTASDQSYNPGDHYFVPRHEMLHALVPGTDPDHLNRNWTDCRLRYADRFTIDGLP